MLLPGAGFDVVPTDCVAASLANALPAAVSMQLAFEAGGGLSPGTAKTSLERLPRDRYEIASEMSNPDAILVRSAKMHEMTLPASVKAIGRAGAGVNNIPVDAMSKVGVPVFNAPGANANAVKELVVAGMLMAVSVRGTGTGLSLAPAVELFSGPSLEDGGLYDVAGDGRFLTIEAIAERYREIARLRARLGEPETVAESKDVTPLAVSETTR